MEGSGGVVVPFNAAMRGRITSVDAIGKGLRRQRASIGLAFDTVEFPDGSTRAVPVRLKAIDNARESVDENGVILGIKPRSPMVIAWPASLGTSSSGIR